MRGFLSHAVRDALHDARWWNLDPDGRVHCYLCPRHCRLHDGQQGFCFVRARRGDRLVSLAYAHPASVQVDPIEKKPLHHFLPGTPVLSLGTAGCNLACSFCQNWALSRARADQVDSVYFPPESIADLAVDSHCPSVALTYNEPTVWAEYGVDICRAARERGLRTVMVTNGYVTREAFHDLYDHLDAVNVDLKSFDETFYQRVTLSHLEPVLETLRRIRGETDVWLEVSHLVVPTLNDDPVQTRRLCDWMAANLGRDVPLHLTAFHPDHKLLHLPATPPATIAAARRIARDAGLRYVYEGNVWSGAGHTDCPGCGAALVERDWHRVRVNRIRDGRCPDCGTAVPGRWDRHAGVRAT